MLTTNQRRTDGDEGFTLTEIMVVVLIIAVLLAIAIPTFFGAKGKAQVRAAQANLRNGLTAEKVVFGEGSAYSQDVTATGVLFVAEPAIKWSLLPVGLGQVGVTVADSNGIKDSITLTAMDTSGAKCWYLFDETTPGSFAPVGTYYSFVAHPAGSSVACAAPAAIGAAAPTAPAKLTGVWGTSW